MAGVSFHVVIAGTLGLTGVVLGAFGAHGLAARGVSAAQLSSWSTAVQYQLFHAVALLALTSWMRQGGPASLSMTANAWIAGVLLFCGSIYCLVLGGPRWLGPVTPIGGLAFMIGWAVLIVAAYRN